MRLETDIRLRAVFTNKDWVEDRLDSIVGRVSLAVEREYKKETPVNKGDLRKFTVIKDGGRFEKTVTTIAKNKGRYYGVYVAGGTGRFKGASGDWPSTGRVRSGESLKNRGSGGIRPNKFPKRAIEGSKDEVKRIIKREIKTHL